MRRIYQLFPALEHRAFFYFITGQTISMLGLWMQRLAMSWLVFRLTNSAFLLSIVEFVSLAPILVLGLMAGAWLERHDLRKALIVTQILCMFEAAMLRTQRTTVEEKASMRHTRPWSVEKTSGKERYILSAICLCSLTPLGDNSQ